MANLIAREVRFHLTLESLKLDLEGSPDFNARSTFKCLDINNYKYIDQQSIRLFLMKMGHQVVRSEITCFLRRFDLDGDQRIKFTEFIEGITPVIMNVPGHALRSQKADQFSLKSPSIMRSTLRSSY